MINRGTVFRRLRLIVEGYRDWAHEFFDRGAEEPKNPADELSSSPYAHVTGQNPKESLPGRIQDAFVFSGLEVTVTDTVALFYPNHQVLLIRDPVTGVPGKYFEWQGQPVERGQPILGDWVGKGRPLFGLYDAAQSCFSLFSDEREDSPLFVVHFGPPASNWIPLAGDWDGDGRAGIGLYDPVSGCFLLKNELVSAPPDSTFAFGPANQGWIPVVGDWNAEGRDKVGVYDPESGLFILAKDDKGGEWSRIETAVQGGRWWPIVGDWRGRGFDSVGLYDPEGHLFRLLDPAPDGSREIQFQFGISGVQGIPLALQWIPEVIDQSQSEARWREEIPGVDDE